MLNDDETMCSSGVKVIDCPDCISYWKKENPSYLKFLESLENGMTEIKEYCQYCETVLSHPDDLETSCFHCGNQCDICNECHYCIRGVNPCKNKMPIDIEREKQD